MLVRAAENGGMADALSGYGPSGSSGVGSPSDFGMSDDADSPGGQVRAMRGARPLALAVAHRTLLPPPSQRVSHQAPPDMSGVGTSDDESSHGTPSEGWVNVHRPTVPSYSSGGSDDEGGAPIKAELAVPELAPPRPHPLPQLRLQPPLAQPLPGVPEKKRKLEAEPPVPLAVAPLPPLMRAAMPPPLPAAAAMPRLLPKPLVPLAPARAAAAPSPGSSGGSGTASDAASTPSPAASGAWVATIPGTAGAAPAPDSPQSRKQSRLIKNREAASLSRQRRKEYLEQLEAANLELLEENGRLRQRVQQLEELVQTLQAEKDAASPFVHGLRLNPRGTSGLVLAVLFCFLFVAVPGWRWAAGGGRDTALAAYPATAAGGRTLQSVHGGEPAAAVEPWTAAGLAASSGEVGASSDAAVRSSNDLALSSSDLAVSSNDLVPLANETREWLAVDAGAANGARAALDAATNASEAARERWPELPADPAPQVVTALANLDTHTAVATSDLHLWLDRRLALLAQTSAVPPAGHGGRGELAISVPPPRVAGAHADHVQVGDLGVVLERRPDAAYVFCPHAMQILPNNKAQDGYPALSLILPSSELPLGYVAHAIRGLL